MPTVNRARRIREVGHIATSNEAKPKKSRISEMPEPGSDSSIQAAGHCGSMNATSRKAGHAPIW